VKRTPFTGAEGTVALVARRIVLTAAGLVAAWIILCLVFFTWSPWATGAPAHADAVVVLSGGRERLPPALALIRGGVAKTLVISSVSRTKHWPLGHRLCATRRYAGATVLCFDADPYSTRGEAEAVERLAREHRWSRVVVVTSRFHVTRARMLFRRCYDGRLWLVGVSRTWWKLPAEWVDETGKLVYQLTVQRTC
jgi:uncharacterized SAM-binding protein YcdF (DUF218 family)